MPAPLTTTRQAPGFTALLPTLAATPLIVTLVFDLVEAIVMTRAIALSLRIGFGAVLEVNEGVGFGVTEVVAFGVGEELGWAIVEVDDVDRGAGVKIGLGLILTLACTVLDCEKFATGNCVAVIVAVPAPMTSIEVPLDFRTTC